MKKVEEVSAEETKEIRVRVKNVEPHALWGGGGVGRIGFEGYEPRILLLNGSGQ